jgi:PAS domain S-box-containing protein
MTVASHEAVQAIHRALLGDALEAATTLAAFLLDDEQHCIAVNEAACRLAGLTRQELVGSRIAGFESLPDEHVLGTGGESSIERPDGGRIAVDYRATMTRIGALRYIVVICWAHY